MTKYNFEISVMSGGSLVEREVKLDQIISLTVEMQGTWVIAIATCPLCKTKKDGKSVNRIVAAKDALNALSSHLRSHCPQRPGDYAYDKSWKPQITRLTEQLETLIK